MIFFVAVHESAIGPKQKWPTIKAMSAFGVKADLPPKSNDVR